MEKHFLRPSEIVWPVCWTMGISLGALICAVLQSVHPPSLSSVPQPHNNLGLSIFAPALAHPMPPGQACVLLALAEVGGVTSKVIAG